jgi:hypothetical protein
MVMAIPLKRPWVQTLDASKRLFVLTGYDAWATAAIKSRGTWPQARERNRSSFVAMQRGVRCTRLLPDGEPYLQSGMKVTAFVLEA